MSNPFCGIETLLICFVDLTQHCLKGCTEAPFSHEPKRMNNNVYVGFKGFKEGRLCPLLLRKPPAVLGHDDPCVNAERQLRLLFTPAPFCFDPHPFPIPDPQGLCGIWMNL